MSNVSGQAAALRAHITRTSRLIAAAQGHDTIAALEIRRQGFVSRLALLGAGCCAAPSQKATSVKSEPVNPNQIQELIDGGALFVANHSGGKDSQAMLIKLLEIVPSDQMLVVHATLGEMEWPGALEHAEQQAKAAGVPFVVAQAGKTLLEMVQHRFKTRPDAPSWPSASLRQCTSDLKRGPIEREIRRYAKERGLLKIVNCMGLRAQESHSRAKLATFKKHERNSVAGRSWYDWLPIHDVSTKAVFEIISAANQQPHPAYAAGNDRLSCVFCIMGSARDLANGAKHNPALFQKYVDLEQSTGYTMHMSRKSLTEIIAEATL